MKIESYPIHELELMVSKKLVELSKDAGMRFTDDDLKHILLRVPYLLKEKFNHVYVELIYESWEKGCTGQYGLSTKITVNNLISWIFNKLRERQEENRIHQNEESEYIEWNERHLSPYGSFLTWLRIDCGIAPQDIDKYHSPEIEQLPSPILLDVFDEYKLAVESGFVDRFKIELTQKYNAEQL